jgi:hypothetical protein
MHAVYVHRHEGLTFFQDYPTKAAAKLALAQYISGARLVGFKVQRRVFTTRLQREDVRLTVWVEAVKEDEDAVLVN